MGLVSGSYPSLINGVSQQPPSLRLPTQGAVQENMISSLVNGLGKRNPTEHIKRLIDWHDLDVYPFVHFINRDSDEKYVLVVDQRSVRAFSLTDGTQYPVKADTHFEKDYVQSSNPQQSIKAMTLGDTTILLNTEKTVLIEDNPTATNVGQALVWVKAGNYLTSYSVTINGETSSLLTQASGLHEADTTTISRKLLEGLQDVLGTEDWNFYRYGSIFWVSRKDGVDFDFKVQDSVAGTYLAGIKETVQRFSDLPEIAHNGQVIKVQGDLGSQLDDYWVKFVTNNSEVVIGPGVWKECVAPETRIRINAKTMPVKLLRTQDEDENIYFKMSRIDWAPRLVGDNEGCPQPSFIDNNLSAIFLYRNRLGFLSKSKIIMSASGDLFNFWRGSAQQTLDDDPIDVEVAHPRVTDLRYALPFGGEMLIFGDAVQFAMTAGDTLTPRTVAVNLATEFESDLLCTPIVAGSAAYFPFSNDSFAGVREYFLVDSTGKHDAAMITGHVPQYIPGHIVKLSASTVENTMVALSSTDQDALYVYNWFYNGSDKVQSSWSTWTFEGKVLGAEFIGSMLYLLMGRDECGLFLEKINLTNRSDGTYVIHLDRRTGDYETLYDAASNTTTITVPFSFDADYEVMVLGEHPLPILNRTTIGCGESVDHTYRQSISCDDGSAGPFVLASLGEVYFKTDGECYFTTLATDTVETNPASDADRNFAADMTLFEDCHTCVTGEAVKYVRLQLCTTGALSDLYVPSVLAPIALVQDEDNYWAPAGQTALTAAEVAEAEGTILTDITPIDGCPDSPTPPYQQVRRCDTGGLVDLWVSTGTTSPFTIAGTCYMFQSGDPRRNYGGVEADDTGDPLTCDTLDCSTSSYTPDSYASVSVVSGDDWDGTYDVVRTPSSCIFIDPTTGGDVIDIRCDDDKWVATITPAGFSTTMTFETVLTAGGPPLDVSWTYTGYTGTAPTSTPVLMLSL